MSFAERWWFCNKMLKPLQQPRQRERRQQAQPMVVTQAVRVETLRNRKNDDDIIDVEAA